MRQRAPAAGPGARRRARRSTCTSPCCRRWRATASRTRCSSSPAGRGRARSSWPAAWRACWRGCRNRRDIVLVDQRGTGRSAPLVLRRRPRPTQPLAEAGRPGAAAATAWRDCRASAAGAAARRPAPLHHRRRDAGRRRRAPRARAPSASTSSAASYGTRAALDYLRQFPQAVRRAVIDGVAPPDMVLPAAFSTDNQAALDALLARPARPSRPAARATRRCAPTGARCWPACRARCSVAHPVTGRGAAPDADARHAAGLVRAPLYVPALASALPLALAEAARGPLRAAGRAWPRRWSGGAHGGAGRGHALLGGLRRGRAAAGAGRRPARRRLRRRPSPTLYRRACADWPRGAVPAAFYTLPPAPAAALVLSGGADPVTPPRHGERVAQALGAKARHVVVPERRPRRDGLACLRDVVFRFIDAADDAEALQVDADCARGMPRPPAFVPVAAGRPAANDDRGAADSAKRFTQGRGRQARSGAGGGRRELHRRRRLHHRPAGPQRRRQDDDAAHRGRR